MKEKSLKLENKKLPLAPFQQWLQGRIEELGYANIAASAGVEERRIRQFFYGYYNDKNGERYDNKYVKLATVDKYCTALGCHILEIYPTAYDE